ncbi:MAG: sugar ABC transporter ATP-binding protein, partial [Eggerthellaceae bacterium]|nr:sugar ABC transporter ATP-binding protein [Eggerthellaceae bacterium]
ILDNARNVRNTVKLAEQSKNAAASRKNDIDYQLSELDARTNEIYSQVGLGADSKPEDMEILLSRTMEERQELQESLNDMNARYGQIKQELSGALCMHSFDDLKLEQQEIKTRRKDSAREFATLQLAKRMLEASIDEWEFDSQPEVYKQAGRLLPLMTDGRWKKVVPSDDGRLQISDGGIVVRDPSVLSTSTCQQLYLSVRLALLICATNVGRSVPVIADDILVMFDRERRTGAARALAHAAKYRQIILLTCHEDVVEEMQRADRNAAYINLNDAF